MARRTSLTRPHEPRRPSRASGMSRSGLSCERWTHLEGLKKQFAMSQPSTPGYHTVDVLIAEGDKVAGRITGYGTHEGDLLGISRTGKQIQMSGMVIWRIKRGKIVEAWGVNDTLSLLQQLGVLPPLGKPPT